MASGLVIGKYQVEKVLGKGAMGVVFEARDPTIDRRVAIKTVRKDLLPKSGESREILERFIREARAAARLNHPNVVAIYELGEEGDLSYIVMEYLSGESLRDVIAKRRVLPLFEAIHIVDQLLDALDYGHSLGIVHRDIKPANLMVDAKGNLKVTDFGVARLEASSLTVRGTVLGTPTYMAPEQIRGEVVDGRADLYSAGVILYELLTGRKPFAGSSTTEIMHKVLNEPHLQPSEANTALPEVFNALFRKALAKQPADRFATGAEFKEAMRRASLSLGLAGGADASEATMIAGRPPVSTPPPAEESNGAHAKLLEEIEAFARSEQDYARLHEADRVSRKQGGPSFPTLAAEAAAQARQSAAPRAAAAAPKVPAAPSASPAATNPGSLLERLKHKADAKQLLDSQRLNLQMAGKQQLSDALQQTFHYLREFCEQLNIIKPPHPASFTIRDLVLLENLSWQGGRADFRKLPSAAEDQLFELVSLRFRLGSGQVQRIERNHADHDRFHNLLFDSGITFQEEEVRNDQHKIVAMRYLISSDVKVEVVLQADYAKGDIGLRLRNVNRIGVRNYRLKPEQLNTETLEHLGSLLLGEESAFEQMFRAGA